MPAQFMSKPPSAQLKGGGMEHAFCELVTYLFIEECLLHQDCPIRPLNLIGTFILVP